MKTVRGAGTRPGRYNGLGVTPRSLCTGGPSTSVSVNGVFAPLTMSTAQNNDRTGLI